MKYTKQVSKEHYKYSTYVDHNRWLSYVHQIESVNLIAQDISKRKLRILEVGIGNKFISNTLKQMGHVVKTVDIAEDLRPDFIGSLPNLKIKDIGKYDCVMCCEVLEHLEYGDVKSSLKRMSELSDFLIISVPHKSLYLSFMIRISLFQPVKFLFSIPTPFIKHKFDGQHYWELGTSGYDLNRFNATIRKAGLEIVKEFRSVEFPWHHFFILKKDR